MNNPNWPSRKAILPLRLITMWTILALVVATVDLRDPLIIFLDNLTSCSSSFFVTLT